MAISMRDYVDNEGSEGFKLNIIKKMSKIIQ